MKHLLPVRVKSKKIGGDRLFYTISYLLVGLLTIWYYILLYMWCLLL